MTGRINKSSDKGRESMVKIIQTMKARELPAQYPKNLQENTRYKLMGLFRSAARGVKRFLRRFD